MHIPYDFVSLKQKVATGDQIEAPRAISTLTKHVDALELKVMELERKLEALEKKAS